MLLLIFTPWMLHSIHALCYRLRTDMYLQWPFEMIEILFWHFSCDIFIYFSIIAPNSKQIQLLLPIAFYSTPLKIWKLNQTKRENETSATAKGIEWIMNDGDWKHATSSSPSSLAFVIDAAADYSFVNQTVLIELFNYTL